MSDSDNTPYALPTGQIRLNEIHIEAGGASGTQCSMNDADIRGIIGKASGTQSRMGEWHGASNVYADFAVDKPKGSNFYVAYGVGYGSASGLSNGNNWNCSVDAQQGSYTIAEFYGAKNWVAGQQYRIDFDVNLSLTDTTRGAIRIAQGYRDYDGFTNESYDGTTNTEDLLAKYLDGWEGAVNGVAGNLSVNSSRHSGYLLYTPNANDPIALALFGGGPQFHNASQTIYSLTITEV